MQIFAKHMRRFRLLISFVGVTLLLLATIPEAFAGSAEPICTDDEMKFSTDLPTGTGVVSTIAQSVQDVLQNMGQDLFQAIEGAGSFRNAMAALLTLYIGILGIMYAFGMVKETIYDFVIRCVKISFIVMLSNGEMWNMFNTYVVPFFRDGTNELINEVTSIAVAPSAGGIATSGAPLVVMDQAIYKALSAKMWVHIGATLSSGYYGMMHAGLMVIALWSFVSSLLLGVWIYLMSMVLRTLLFGLAPIFIACLLFDRTKPLFLGWLNQLIGACLQPIFLFTFFTFFLLLISGAIDRVLYVPVCWTEVSDSMRGTAFLYKFWRYMVPDGSGGWEETDAQWGPTGTNQPGDPIFPIDILGVLIFLILSQLGSRFNQISLMIAKDIAASSVNLLSMQGGLKGVFTPGGQDPTSGTIGSRINPDGSRTRYTQPGTTEVSARTQQAQENVGRVRGAVGDLVDRISNLGRSR